MQKQGTFHHKKKERQKSSYLTAMTISEMRTPSRENGYETEGPISRFYNCARRNDVIELVRRHATLRRATLCKSIKQ